MDRYERLRRIQKLDPATDYHTIYREMVQFEFPEIEMAFILAFIRPFGVPAISRVTAHTGEIANDARRRSTDTAILLYTIFEYGFNNELGRKALQRLNAVHRHWRSTNSNADYLYVLATLIIPPIRFLDRYGWRKTCRNEHEASFVFYRELARHMAIKEFPASYDELVRWFDAYERENMYYDPANAKLMDAMHEYIARQVPAVLRWPVTRALDSLLDDPVRDAIGLSRPPLPIRLLTTSLLFGSGFRRRHSPGNDKPYFEFGRPFGVYTEPYDLDDIGPADQRDLARQFEQGLRDRAAEPM